MRNMETGATKAGPTKNDIIIIGAGLSGLTSALKIATKENSLQVRVLEATNKIGGQLLSHRLGEIGGKWITEDQFHIYNMCKELQTPLRRRILLAPNKSRCWDIDRGGFSFFVKHELYRYIHELDLSCQYFRPGQHNPYTYHGSMRRHINKRLWFSKSRKFMVNLVILFSGSDASDIGYNEFMSICWSNGGLKRLMNLYLDCPDTLWEVSSQHLLQELQDKLENVEFLFKRKVDEIRHFRDSVEVYDSEREVHMAEVVILAIPWNNIEDIKFSPAIPMELRKPPPPIDRCRNMITSFLAKYLDGPWRIAGYSGKLFLNEPLLIVGHEYKSTTYGGVVIHEDSMEPLIRSVILQALADQFGDDMLLPIEYSQRSFDLSSMSNVPFTTPWNRIVWSSSATAASCYRGRMGGAVQSGLRAAMNALFILRPQTVGWQDIAEIQCSELLINPRTTRFDIWISSWNLFSFSYYSLLSLGFATALRLLYKNYI